MPRCSSLRRDSVLCRDMRRRDVPVRAELSEVRREAWLLNRTDDALVVFSWLP